MGIVEFKFDNEEFYAEVNGWCISFWLYEEGEEYHWVIEATTDGYHTLSWYNLSLIDGLNDAYIICSNNTEQDFW